jgi:capsular polysaccharide biosynthesis protein
MNDSQDKFEEEIELIDILRTVWKWKYLIMVGTVVCAIVAAVISISKPNIYRVETILKPGVLEINDKGQEIYVDSPTNIKALIEAGTFNNEIKRELKDTKTSNLPTSFQFEINIPKIATLLKISYETPSVDTGISILNQLTNSISREQAVKIDYLQTKFEKEILEDKIALSGLQDELRSNQTSISKINKRLAELSTDIQSLNRNISALTKHRDTILSNRNEETILTGFLYNNTIQQNLDLRNRINNQILNYTIEKERVKNSSKRIEREIDILSKKIDDLKNKKSNIMNIQVLKSPNISQNGIKTKIKRNIVLATIVGLFLILFFVFFLEYVFKHIREKDS